jgi:hypothetical protein
MPSNSRTVKPLNFASRSVCNLIIDARQLHSMASPSGGAQIAQPDHHAVLFRPCPNLIVNHTIHEALNYFTGDISKFHCGGSFSLSARTMCLSSHNINSDPGFIPTA